MIGLSPAAAACRDDAPRVAPSHLDQLWFQVTGTRCNLACHHCFISCSPHNESFGFLTRDAIRRRLEESVPLGVKEYYFTGGEPFLHPQMTEILCDALSFGPTSVLTNGTVLKDGWIERLRDAESAGPFSLEFRVSLDGFSADTNDPIRGDGTFDRAMRGVERLVAGGFLPIITAARTWPDEAEGEIVGRFIEMLRSRGYQRPRLKILPTLRLGAEVERNGGYAPTERVTREMLDGFDVASLICSSARIVTDRGVHVCPILIDAADSILGATLAESLRPFPIAHGACFTCYQFGSICSNPSGWFRESGESSKE